jgi:2-dehydropantoate 2-reductase
MRVAVVGTGAVGGTIAALLARAGHDVEVTARGPHLAAIQDHGLVLGGAWGDYTARVAAGRKLVRIPELAFVTTKANDAEAAIRDNAGLLAGVPVVVVQNGLRGIETAQRVLRSSDVIGGLAMFAASYLSPGHVEVTTDGKIYLGDAATTPSMATLYAAEVLGEVLPVVATTNFVGAQWTKLVVNQINALPAITGLSAQEVIGTRLLRRLMTRSMREAVRVGIAENIRFAALQGLSNTLLRVFAWLPISLGQLLPLAMNRRMGRVPNPGSTLQSIRRGQLTEIDYLNGAIVTAGERLGVPTPVNRKLTELVHAVEASGKFVEPRTISERVG